MNHKRNYAKEYADAAQQIANEEIEKMEAFQSSLINAMYTRLGAKKDSMPMREKGLIAFYASFRYGKKLFTTHDVIDAYEEMLENKHQDSPRREPYSPPRYSGEIEQALR